MTQRVLILCTGNSCRSQMAEALWQKHGGSQWQANSAGSDPAGYVHPMAIAVMRESGEDISEYVSKSVNEFLDQSWDMVVTVCDRAQESCPTLPGAKRVVHWPFDDPARAQGSDAERLSEFRRVRDEIESAICDFLQTDVLQTEDGPR